MYLIDTNTCIFIINKRPEQVLRRLQAMLDNAVYISSITVAELHYGVYTSQSIEKNRIALAEFLSPFEILPFDDSDAEKSGALRAKLKKQGQMIGLYDLPVQAGFVVGKRGRRMRGIKDLKCGIFGYVQFFDREVWA